MSRCEFGSSVPKAAVSKCNGDLTQKGDVIRPKTAPSNNVAEGQRFGLPGDSRNALLPRPRRLRRRSFNTEHLNTTDGSAKRNSEVQPFAVPDARGHLAVLGRVGDAVCVEHVLVRMHWFWCARHLVSSQNCRPPAPRRRPRDAPY
jgi:hypothetical protein